MKKHTGWKKTAAFVLSMALVVGAMPANVGGLLTTGTSIVASAAGNVIEGDVTWDYDEDYNQDEVESDMTINGNVTLNGIEEYDSDEDEWDIDNFYVGETKKCVVVINGNLTIQSGDLAPCKDSIVIVNGDYTNQSEHNYGVICYDKSKFIVTGTITNDRDVYATHTDLNDIQFDSDTQTFTVNGVGGYIFNYNNNKFVKDISTATVNLNEDNTVKSITFDGAEIEDLSGFNITYGTDTNHTATTVPTESGTYYAFVTAKNNNETYGGTAKSAEFTVTAAPTFSNASVTLADDLALNFYVDGIADETAAAEYSVKFEGECVDKTSALAYNATEGKYYATTHVYAKDINQKITAKLYKGENECGTAQISIADYLTTLAASPDQKTQALALATKLFGDASAAYFNPTETVNDTSVAAEITTYMTQANISDAALTAMAAQYATTFDSDAAKLSLVLDSKTAARLYVKGDETGTASTISSTKADYPTYHEITGLLPQNLADEQTITVGGTDYKFSALTWCYRVATNGSASQKNINMAKAIMAYYEAAKNYTAPANPYVSATSKVNDVVQFGGYDWYVIGKSNDGVTLLMKENLETRKYNASCTDTTWETCTLRTYLNGEFYNSFSAEDKAKIVNTSNTNPNNPDSDTNGGSDTDDYIYLLSTDEANALDNSIRAIGSAWWLRSPGDKSYRAAYVIGDGYVSAFGALVDSKLGVRPALNLEF